MTEIGTPPGVDEFEITLIGPGYGESIVLHIGDGLWVLVDSCLDEESIPSALRYLQGIGVDPAQAVRLIVATHWHDDHIRGIAALVEVCHEATFCCASVLCEQEFLTVTRALEGHHHSATGSGVREIYRVVSQLVGAESTPTLALANRRVYMHGGCEIWSLSPNDADYLDFLRVVHRLLPEEGKSKTRIPNLSPNDVSVVLWIQVDNIALLLGADLAKRGWAPLIENPTRPDGRASVFKIPHHGAKSAHDARVWEKMMIPNPIAILTPWQRGGRELPNPQDMQRILSYTTNAYSTARPELSLRAPVRRSNMVKRTLRESGIRLRRQSRLNNMVRLRRTIGSETQWTVETFGRASHLRDMSGQ